MQQSRTLQALQYSTQWFYFHKISIVTICIVKLCDITSRRHKVTSTVL